MLSEAHKNLDKGICFEEMGEERSNIMPFDFDKMEIATFSAACNCDSSGSGGSGCECESGSND
ncbi:MAG: hypothetical protein PHO56_04500 [Patescibacteria group bacterium]|nr:hypothetical protein [Patescibacteria group bacterium]